jgi:hypothetical protein
METSLRTTTRNKTQKYSPSWKGLLQTEKIRSCNYIRAKSLTGKIAHGQNRSQKSRSNRDKTVKRRRGREGAMCQRRRVSRVKEGAKMENEGVSMNLRQEDENAPPRWLVRMA